MCCSGVRSPIAARAELLSALGSSPLPVAVPSLLSRAAAGEPLGRCHIALRRLPGRALEGPQVADSPAADLLVSDLAQLLDRLRSGARARGHPAQPRAGV